MNEAPSPLLELTLKRLGLPSDSAEPVSGASLIDALRESRKRFEMAVFGNVKEPGGPQERPPRPEDP